MFITKVVFGILSRVCSLVCWIGVVLVFFGTLITALTDPEFHGYIRQLALIVLLGFIARITDVVGSILLES